ncbi:MAG: hypothetical protein AAFY04_02860, partial [Pseudomonadota bacterium]
EGLRVVGSGVAQGSVLGLLLFLICINVDGLETKFRIFADDLKYLILQKAPFHGILNKVQLLN